MKKFSLYTITFFAVGITVLLISFFSFQHIYSLSKEDLFNAKFEAGKREAREIGKLLEMQLKQGIPKETVIQNLQNSIVNTDTQSSFICMYNQKGIELCHPNPALVGQIIDKDNSTFTSGSKHSDFIEILNAGKESTGTRHLVQSRDRRSEIVSVFPVGGSDWMVASHANLEVINEQIRSLYLNFSIAFLLATLLILVVSFLLIRMIYRKYEAAKNSEINDLNDEINMLTAINTQLNSIHERLKLHAALPSQEDPAENSKRRVITYQKDELISLETSEIAYFFLENNIVYIKTTGANQYPITSSLDELIKTLDQKMFYRANRQFIINIKAISNILLYGKNQLKIVTMPESKETILISKNRVAEFKKWLEQ